LKNLFVFQIVLLFLSSALAQGYFEHLGLREVAQLVIKISDLSVTPCPECRIQLDRDSYKIEVKDAYLKLAVEETASGPSLIPYLESYYSEEKGVSIWEDPSIIPEEGLYIGSVWKTCAPWGKAADGSCQDRSIQYRLEGKVESLLEN
jgi:hypothetical protein